jgi:putative DNA primase/helicase
VPDNPYLQPAIDAVTSHADNVAGSVEFLVARLLTGGHPQDCYSEELIRAVAATEPRLQRDISRKLKQRFAKDLNLIQWRADVREAMAALAATRSTGDPGGFIRSDSGNIKPILANAIRALMESPVQVAYNAFSCRVVHLCPSPWGTEGPWHDIDDIAAANYLQHHGIAVGPPVANEAAYFIAHENEFHPVREWLLGLQWDGSPRLDFWMINGLGSEDSQYSRTVGAKWMLSAIARILEPGSKVDHLLVLEGPQGTGKSSALRALANGHMGGSGGHQWFRDNMPDIDKDDIGLFMQGVWIIEIAELEAIRGKQWTRTKAFISSQTDSFRRKFGRNMQDYPRQCVFAGSTNEAHWGGDPTGLRRFWPIRVGKINLDAILRDAEQLWAEARFRYDEDEKWCLDEETEKIASEHQAERSPDDSWVARVARAVEFQTDVTLADVLASIGLSINQHGPGEQSRAGRALISLGWERYRSGMADGRLWRYRKT